MIVIDASLATKLIIRESDSDAAGRWLLSIADDVAAPDLIAIEVAQTIVRRVNTRNISRSDGRQILREWRAMLDRGGIAPLRTDVEQMEIAVEIAMQLGHPVKDCVYLGLAMEFECDLVTSDVKFAAKARTLYPAVRWLSDYAA